MASTPDPPSYESVIKAIKKTKKTANKQRKEQEAWGEDYYQQAQDLNLDIVGDLDEIRAWQMQSAKDTEARTKNVWEPLEDEQMMEIDQYQQRAGDFDAEVQKLKDEATAYKSEANQKYMAGKAIAEVGQTFSVERADAERALRDAGVNPSSGASQSLTAGLRLAEGAAQAAAGTTAADATRQEGDARYQEALDRQIQAAALAESGLNQQKAMVDVGRTYPAQTQAQLQEAQSAGKQAIDQTVAITEPALQSEQLSQNYLTQQLDSLKTWTDTLDTGFKNELDLYSAETERQKAEAEESSGIGGALGILAAGVKAFVAGGGYIEKFDNGGGVSDPSVIGPRSFGSGRTPTGPSALATAPSTDTVPSKLTPGEFVIPKHVVDWKGQQFFQNLIKKSPQQRETMIAETGAKPSIQQDAGAVLI